MVLHLLPGERIPVILLLPKDVDGPAPAVHRLHCHGDLYYFGKKKLVEEENEPQLLTRVSPGDVCGIAIANESGAPG